MRSIWYSLLWKEWHEQRWKLAALSAAPLMVFVITVAWHGRIERGGLTPGDLVQISAAILSCYGFLAGMFLGMSAAARENGAGTMRFLQTLPTDMWKAGCAKLLVTSVVAAIPIALVMLAAAFCYLISPEQMSADFSVSTAEFSMGRWFLRAGLTFIAATVSIVWWMAAIGVNRSDEIRAGAIGFLVVVGMWLGLAYSLDWCQRYRLTGCEVGLAHLTSAAPGGFLFWQMYCNGSEQFIKFDHWPSPVGVVVTAAVAYWYLARFARTPARTGRGEGLAAGGTALRTPRAPFHSPVAALAWKQVRETGPLAVFALAAALAMAAIADRSSVERPSDGDFANLFLAIGGSMGMLVVFVTGIGLYLEELRPEVEQFWRSRPLPLGLLFVVKYTVGILVLMGVLGVPLLAAIATSDDRVLDAPVMELAARFLFLVWLVFMPYSLAMTAQCLLRQPIYAVVVAVLALWLGSAAYAWAFPAATAFDVGRAMATALVGTVALGWLAVRYDWGWKR